MHKQILLLDLKLFAAGSDVALFEEEQLHILSHQSPHSDVKFPFVDQQRLFNVLLDDKGGGFYILVYFADGTGVHLVLELC